MNGGSASYCRRVITRRSFVIGTLATGCIHGVRGASKQPLITHGVQVGDVAAGARWSGRAATSPRGWSSSGRRRELRARGASPARPVAVPDPITRRPPSCAGSPTARRSSYRVRFEREAARGASAWATGRFRTPRADTFRFAWTGDTCGQGFGRNPDWGGLRGYAAIRAAEPAFFLHSGDLIYADNPILAEMALADGRVWRNVTNERVGRVAQELDDFRARFAYNLEDEHVRALAAEVPILAQWDDHETHNNWWPGPAARGRPVHQGARRLERSSAMARARDARVDADRAARRSIAWSRTGRCSTCSSSICARSARRTTTTAAHRRDARHGRRRAWLVDAVALDARAGRSSRATSRCRS